MVCCFEWEDDNFDGLRPLEAPRVGPICSPCNEACIECYGPSSENCTRCEENWFLNAPDLDPYICYAPCRFDQWDDDVTNPEDPWC